eukprot:CAMPEP_0172392190 /NCGR_PEP_ID=MMETSP1061-20121228/8391_1 /TAXON_ID=37318 /ORGANISM="Pseudo-nitzschia pungens, Strain cf. pungens" /LENGTH=46 /DNA_ID= /DNA_START= /DNA_END= /DNA_ORIENTATION=
MFDPLTFEVEFYGGKYPVPEENKRVKLTFREGIDDSRRQPFAPQSL